jgi:hypothetical protein
LLSLLRNLCLALRAVQHILQSHGLLDRSYAVNRTRHLSNLYHRPAAL